VLVPAIIALSLLSGLSGFATGLVSLIFIRALMGISEGSFCPTSFAATNDASNPARAALISVCSKHLSAVRTGLRSVACDAAAQGHGLALIL
jgi:MFS family permease